MERSLSSLQMKLCYDNRYHTAIYDFKTLTENSSELEKTLEIKYIKDCDGYYHQCHLYEAAIVTKPSLSNVGQVFLEKV